MYTLHPSKYYNDTLIRMEDNKTTNINYFFRKAVGAILVWRLKKALKRVGSEKPNALRNLRDRQRRKLKKFFGL